MADEGETIHVEVACATPRRQRVVALTVPAGITAGEAVRRSRVLEAFPELGSEPPAIGVFGEACRAERVLEDGDRVEIYRPLAVDPKAARRRRAEGDNGR